MRKLKNIDSDPDHWIKKSMNNLLAYCKKNNWAGFDPFDGLNSRVFAALSFMKNNHIARLIFIQTIKRLPFNLRPILLIPRGRNPKGLALFTTALIRLSRLGVFNEDETIKALIKTLIDLRSPEKPFYCWGYNFDWQARDGFLPRYYPSAICTIFAGNAMLDAYEKYKDEKYVQIAVSAARFILKELNIAGNGNEVCFSYTPYDHGQVHNSNMLTAAYLARIYSITREKEFIQYATQAISYSANKQNHDGSWYYGEDKSQKWIDNFHTGFNLIALNNFNNYTEYQEFTNKLEKGYKYYINNLFTEEGLPKYYHDQLYPIDIHSISQSIITLVELKHLDPKSIDLAYFIFKWTITNMQDKKGYFYYQKKRFYKNKIPYMRWSQAWMLYAMSILAEKCNSIN